MQKVQLVIGGGTSEADEGPASSLRLPKKITALTTAPDGTVWLAAQDSSDSAPQILSVSPSGQARRIRLAGDSRNVDSLAIGADGVLWAATTDTVIWRLQGQALRAAYGTLWRKPGHFPGPFVADGKPLSSAHLGLISSVAVDSQGRLVFEETEDSCERIRRLNSNGTVTSLVGGAVRCPDERTRTEIQAARFPDSRTTAAKLPIDIGGSFALGPDDRVYVYTMQTVLSVDATTGKVNRVVGAPESISLDFRPKIDNGSKPFGSSKTATELPLLQTTGTADGKLTSGNLGVAADGAIALMTTQEQVSVSRAFTWQVTGTQPKIVMAPDAEATASVQVVHDRAATTASVIRGMLAFRGNDLLEGVSRPGGAVVAAITR